MPDPTRAPTNRRRHRRHATCNLRGNLLFQTRADVADVSRSGISIRTRERLYLGREYTITIARGGRRILSIDGHVVWCDLATTDKGEGPDLVPIYQAGLELDDMESLDTQRFLAHLKQDVVLTLEDRLGGRFTFSIGSDRTDDPDYDFVVRTISLSGMLIETDLRPDREARCHMEIDLLDFTLTLSGRVAYIKQPANGDGGVSELGLEFTALTPQQRELLQTYIEGRLARG
jgi:hypothetical protein